MLAQKIVDPGVAHYNALKVVERRRVAAIIANDRQGPVRIDEKAKAKRPGEGHEEWQRRLAKMGITERPIGEARLTPEAEQHGDYVDATVEHIDDQTGVRTRAVTKRNRSASPLAMLRDHGELTEDQYRAAVEIAAVPELLARAVAIRSGGIEARVDCSKADADDLWKERLNAARLERAYTMWRDRLPTPRQLFIDLVKAETPLARLARSVPGMGWPRAKRLLRHALDRWDTVKDAAWRNIDEDELAAAHELRWRGPSREENWPSQKGS